MHSAETVQEALRRPLPVELCIYSVEPFLAPHLCFPSSAVEARKDSVTRYLGNRGDGQDGSQEQGTHMKR